MEIPFEIIGKYLSGESSREEIALLEKWRQEKPENEEEFLLIMMGWGNSFNNPEQFEEVKEAEYAKVNKHIKSGRNKTPRVFLWSAAAAAVFILGIIYLGFNENTGEERLASYKALNKRKLVTLIDGTKIWLNKGAELTLEGDFNQKDRQVRLTGEAYFDIERNENKPFIIQTEATRTTVLGTEFNLRESLNNTVQLIVVEGKVAFESIDASEKEIVNIGEQAVYSNKTVLKSAEISFNELAWKTKKLVFKNEEINEVAKLLSAFYEVEIKIDSLIKQDKINLTIDHNTLDEAIEILETINQYKVVKKDKSYQITLKK